jgi:hypothetical protein
MNRVGAWIAVTVVAFMVVGGMLHFPGTLDGDGPALGPVILGGMTGLLIGGAQLVVLRPLLRHPWHWPAASAIGIAVTHAIGDGVSADVGYVPVAIIGGLATGALQAAVLRVPLWAVATTLAFAIGIAGGHALGFALGFNSIFPDDAVARGLIILGLTATLYALFTAPLFARMSRKNGVPILGSNGAA